MPNEEEKEEKEEEEEEEETTALVGSICQFRWCKYFDHGQVQATNVTSLNAEMGRNANNWFLTAGRD